MIERLSVRNFILVEALELEFSGGFNVLSGETGAGKSILVGALSVLFGGKGGPDLVREGSDEAVVAGEFMVTNHPACNAWLNERGIESDDGLVLVRRTLKTSGRGTIYVQNTPVTRADLEEFSGFLLDLHSQHEHQSLFHEVSHRRLLDRYAGIEGRVVTFGEIFARLSTAQQELRTLDERARDRAREVEMLEFALEEIEAAGVRPGEWAELEAERSRMAQHEKLAGHVEGVCRLFDDGEGGSGAISLSVQFKQARQELNAASHIDEALQAEAERLEGLYYELEDLEQNIVDYRDRLVYDPARLDQIEERIALLRDLQRKYGKTEDEILAYAAEAGETITSLRSVEESRDQLNREISGLEQRIGAEARAIHAERRNAAEALQAKISSVLGELAMGQARFVVQVESKTSESGRLICGASGADRVRFLISTNKGVTPRPLSEVASGGEISRVMLAIKTVLAGSDDIRSLVFDEIDTGIGGNVALALAAHLRNLAGHAQVICITHLATIAVRADNHIAVEKFVQDDRTTISARSLGAAEREQEIARMLSGDGEEHHGLEHARALLERYQREAHGKDK